MNEKKLTPMMLQWHSCKQEAKGALLLFRLGDFYEAFYEDAHTLARELDITLTHRHEVPMSGIPWHTAENYIDRLVEKGFKVAVAEQVESASTTLMERKIVRIITPGTLMVSSLLSEKANNYIVCVAPLGSFIGLSFCDITTSELKVTELPNHLALEEELLKIAPKEIVVGKKYVEKYPIREIKGATITLQEELLFNPERAVSFLHKHFQVSHLDCFGLKEKNAAALATGALLLYLKQELNCSLNHLQTLSFYTTQDTLFLDAAAEKNLELIEPLVEKNKKATLFYFLDKTVTSMGGRRLMQWLKKPLRSVEEIKERQVAIDALYYQYKKSAAMQSLLKEVKDLERLVVRVQSRLASPRDLLAIALSLEKIFPIRAILSQFTEPLLQTLNHGLLDIGDIAHWRQKYLVEEPPLRLGEAPTFQSKANPLLEELREKTKNSKQWLLAYQAKMKEESGIKSLKIGFHKSFGYYFEVSKGQSNYVPPSFQKMQTLVTGDRFTTAALKEYEVDLLTAEDKIKKIEESLFEELCKKVEAESLAIYCVASTLATLDTLLSLSQVAKEHHFVAPLVDKSNKLEITGGRHPIVEAFLPKNRFIPNDTKLDEQELIMLITGPNMAGKSTYIRQVALIVILAQMGSFVPAQKAHIGIVDKIFTRIGANDDLARGQSTFMVEMSETANILNNATEQSLIILDEIGRGTSTYDGLSIAWAVVEYLATHKEKRAKTLFATHYGELTDLAKKLSQIVNYHALVEENAAGISFLHKIAPGIAPRSYGIHVARLAGIPLPVIARATTILSRLEKLKAKKEEKQDKEEQLLLF